MEQLKLFEGPLTQLGGKATEPIAASQIETFPAPGPIDLIEFETAELTARCPITSQPDWYTLCVTYQPKLRCIESKSLKLYLLGFRDRGAFIEQLARTICDDLVAACCPKRMTVELKMAARGGITILVMAHGGVE